MLDVNTLRLVNLDGILDRGTHNSHLKSPRRCGTAQFYSLCLHQRPCGRSKSSTSWDPSHSTLILKVPQATGPNRSTPCSYSTGHAGVWSLPRCGTQVTPTRATAQAKSELQSRLSVYPVLNPGRSACLLTLGAMHIPASSPRFTSLYPITAHYSTEEDSTS